jgi:serine/threonine protein phosphatase PrpC
VPQLGAGLTDWSFFAVFDGHAGNNVAQYVSQHLLDQVLATGETNLDKMLSSMFDILLMLLNSLFHLIV